MEVPPQSPGAVVRFGVFELDLRTAELRKQGVRVRLQQQAFRALVLLLERRGELVTREELRRVIWRDTAVAFEEGIDAVIYKLRNALGDSAENPRFVETLPRRGYRFIAPVHHAPLGETPRDPSAQEIPRAQTASRRRMIVLTTTAAAAIAIAFARYIPDLLRTRRSSGRIQSIAVLPLKNLSGDAANEYFADGVTDALITQLGQNGALRVISSTSAIHYKGSRQTLPQIARELGVDAIVEGAVLREGSRVRITGQLLEASTDRHLWAQTYEADVRNVLALEDEVARAITNEVTLRLSLPERNRGGATRAVNPSAYEHYLRGRHLWNEWSEPALRKSVEQFASAVREDEAYAPGWAGLADAYGFMTLFGFLPADVGLPKAKAAALRAIALDETLSEAHVSLAGISLHLEWAWAASEAEVRRAIALNPNNAMAHQLYGYYLSALGQFDTAIAEMKRALEIDPLSANKQNSLAATFYRAGRYDEALEHFRRVPDPDANSEFRHRRMAAIYERKGMWADATSELAAALRLAGRTDIAASVEREYASSGYAPAKRSFLIRDVRDLEKRANDPYPRPLAIEVAADYAMLGDNDKAFAWLARALREHDAPLMFLKVDDRLDGLRSDPRLEDLIRAVGLVP